MRQVPNWIDYFMSIAETISTRSKDPSTQVGCVIVNMETKTIVSGGYNGLPMGMPENKAVWSKPEKYKYVCHAEANAIALAARYTGSLEGKVVFITCAPCLACARLLIQAGIKSIIVKGNKVASRYEHEYEDMQKMLGVMNINYETQEEVNDRLKKLEYNKQRNA